MTSASRLTNNDRQISNWLLVLCVLVFAMVVLGGVTRLTGSGLSMVDWEPVKGIIPPLSAADWDAEFARYQASPEFREVNAHMNVEDFKGIFWLEYLHRLLGRIIGIVFLLPFLYFAMRGDIRKRDWPKYLLMFVLGGMQGLLGWYMVKSGLVDEPRVSQYRLTAHLLAAFLIFAYMLWIALSLRHPKRREQRHPWFSRGIWLTALISVTIVSGGFVAGLKAGKIFNSFPKMGEHWIAPGVMALEPKWRNFFDNPALAQFDHRVLAMTTLLVTLWFWLRLRATAISPRTWHAANALAVLVLLQFSLGIATLLMHVPVALGAIHQGVAMLVFAAALYLLHSLREAP